MLKVAFAVVLALAVMSLPQGASAQESDIAGAADHPLIPRYKGSIIRGYKLSQFDSYTLATGKARMDNKAVVSEAPVPLEGKVTHLLYRAPPQRSALEVFRNYESALREAGFETMFSCALKDCSPTFNRMMNPGTQYNALLYSDEQRYLAARLKRPQGDVYVALYVTMYPPDKRAAVLLNVVEVKPMQQQMVVVKASEMEQALTRDGRIAIYGILFDFDKAEIKSESQPQIEQLGVLLKGNPKLDVLIVGHTDGQGAFDYNLSLSQRRAQAVVRALTASGIAEPRLMAAGAGMTAPVASNRSEEGRAKNRRVEIVERVPAR